jgi:Recombinational DNA repair protein (RecF pathway)
MSFTEFPSRLLENAVNEFASLPGVGRKTAFRLVMNLLRRDSEEVRKFGESIIRLHQDIHYCKICKTFQILKYAISATMKRGRDR